ncbi:hypothetical protein BH23BAC1_BH23BAC1_49950 [soil metagenome]
MEHSHQQCVYGNSGCIGNSKLRTSKKHCAKRQRKCFKSPPLFESSAGRLGTFNEKQGLWPGGINEINQKMNGRFEVLVNLTTMDWKSIG